MRTTWLLPVGLAAAIGLPYVFSSSSGVKDRVMGLLPGANAEGADRGAADKNHAGQAAIDGDAGVSDAPIEGLPVTGMSDVFRFDVTTAWVLGRWPRVTTRLAELQLQGYRVPLVTGTAEDDIAGSLTYYFNPAQRVERITFFGTTGDARKLVRVMALHHGFTRRQTDDPGLYLYEVRYNGKAVSELQIRPAKIVAASQRHRRFEVALRIQRPAKMK